MAEMIASVSNLIWLFGIALLFGGSYIFKALDVPEPKYYVAMKENPVMSFGVLFVINSFGASQLSTGAFEITLDGVVIFSKLQSGRLPQLVDIVNGLVSQGFKEVAPYME
jgi:selT/selW/selH-like putative selenoprotein